jgi:hypothetical protein
VCASAPEDDDVEDQPLLKKQPVREEVDLVDFQHILLYATSGLCFLTLLVTQLAVVAGACLLPGSAMRTVLLALATALLLTSRPPPGEVYRKLVNGVVLPMALLQTAGVCAFQLELTCSHERSAPAAGAEPARDIMSTFALMLFLAAAFSRAAFPRLRNADADVCLAAVATVAVVLLHPRVGYVDYAREPLCMCPTPEEIGSHLLRTIMWASIVSTTMICIVPDRLDDDEVPVVLLKTATSSIWVAFAPIFLVLGVVPVQVGLLTWRRVHDTTPNRDGFCTMPTWGSRLATSISSVVRALTRLPKALPALPKLPTRPKAKQSPAPRALPPLPPLPHVVDLTAPGVAPAVDRLATRMVGCEGAVQDAVGRILVNGNPLENEHAARTVRALACKLANSR